MTNKEEEEEKGNVKVVYLEIIRKDEYAEWKVNPQFVGDTLKKPRTPDSLRPIGQEHRFDISHLNKNFEAWHAKVATLPIPLYSYAAVNSMTDNSPSRKFQYVLDDLTWECEYSVKLWVSQQDNVKKTLVIRMPNDGYFYINGIAMEHFLGAKVLKMEVFNSRHRNTVYEGWSILDKTVWEKLAPFKTFMITWFETSYDPDLMELLVLYHANANRLDLCMRHQDTHVSIEFSFEHSYPIALEDGWWSTF
jgi:hypothetical protein